MSSSSSSSSDPAPSKLQVLRTWFARTELGPLAALLALVVVFWLLDMKWGGQQFATVRNLRVLLTQNAVIAAAALGMTIIIIAGGIDLSVGTTVTLCATVLAYCLKQDVAIGLGLLATVAVGCGCGLLNGALISTLRVVPFIVTLGTMTIFLGVGKYIANESTIHPTPDQIPNWLGYLLSPSSIVLQEHGWLTLPLGVWFTVLLSLLVAAILRYTVFGRHVFALGSNEPTARLCGVNIAVTKMAVYALAGFFVAVAGVYNFANLKLGNPEEGRGLELKVIAAVVIGGGSLRGGRGSVLGSLTGVAIMAVLRSGCDQLLISNRFQEIIIGVMIVAAVAVDQLRQRRLP